MRKQYQEMAQIHKILGDPIRIEIIDILSYGARCVCHLLESFSITQPTLSYHLKLLEKNQIIHASKKGTWVYYELNYKFLNAFYEEFKYSLKPKINHDFFNHEICEK